MLGARDVTKWRTGDVLLQISVFSDPICGLKSLPTANLVLETINKCLVYQHSDLGRCTLCVEWIKSRSLDHMVEKHEKVLTILRRLRANCQRGFIVPKSLWIVLKLVKLTLGKVYFMKNNVWMQNGG